MKATTKRPTPEECLQLVRRLIWRLAWRRAGMFGARRREQEAERYYAAGSVAVVLNADKHDESRGKFTTFAHHVALNAMRQSDDSEFLLGDGGYRSLDAMLGDDLDLGDVAKDCRVKQAELGLHWSPEQWGRLLATLPKARERGVVLLYYVGGLTFRQIGKRMGFSYARAQQIHAAALERLKHSEFLKQEAADAH